MIYSLNLKDRILISIMCAMMFVFGSITSCVSGVTEYFSDKPVVESVDIGEPIVIDEPKPEPKVDDLHGTIVMYTSDGCIWCTRWKANELPKVQKATWKYQEVCVTDGPVPRFDIHLNGKVSKHTGYLDMPTLRRIVEGR